MRIRLTVSLFLLIALTCCDGLTEETRGVRCFPGLKSTSAVELAAIPAPAFKCLCFTSPEVV